MHEWHSKYTCLCANEGERFCVCQCDGCQDACILQSCNQLQLGGNPLRVQEETLKMELASALAAKYKLLLATSR